MSKGLFSEHVRFNTDRELSVGGVTVASLASAHSTPTYIYSLDQVLDSFRTIRDAYAVHHNNVTIHYSLKANANFSIVKALVKEGCGIDCVSAGEVFKALRCGCDPEHIVFAGVGKTREELEFAIDNGVGWFNVENELELSHLNNIAEAKGAALQRPVRVALRLNPDVQANTHPNIATGHGGAKFGLPIEVAESILQRADAFPHLTFKGLHCHIGSQLGDTVATRRAIEIAVALVEKYPSITALNIGGGMPVSYDGSEKPPPSDFAAAVCPLLQKYEVMLEPGRSIVASAGVLVTRVLYRKDQAGHKMLIVDASMTELMRPALYQAKHAVFPVVEADPSEPLEQFTLVGPVCETTDVLAREVMLPARCGVPGQLLVLMTTGAYGFAMANNYNARPLPAQVVVRGGVAAVSTARQTFADLLRDELDGN